VAHVIGGFGPDDRRMSEFLRSETAITRVAAVAGAATAADLTARRSCALVVGCEDDEAGRTVRETLHTPPTLRVYRTPDIRGVEFASALVSAVTVAIGLADGLNVGEGARAQLMSRALTEISRIGASSGASHKTFLGLAALGSVLVRTAKRGGTESNDYQLGLAIARDEVPPEWQTEGVRSLAAGVRLARLLGLSVPLLEMVYQVVGREISLDVAQDRLLNLELDFE
jgi:glycerol-3-phosphate dehydrogenase (NAD(P)+)